VSVSQGRQLTQNLTARLSRSMAVVDYLLPHFDTVHCLRYVLLNTAATATYFVGHCGHCLIYCWTLSTVHCQVYYAFGRCLRSEVYFVGHTGNCHEFVRHRQLFTARCILLDILATVIYFNEHTGSCQYILLDTLATVMNLLDTGNCSLPGVFCWTLLSEVYFVQQTGNCHVFC